MIQKQKKTPNQTIQVATLDNFDACLDDLTDSLWLGLDTETFGLDYNQRLFSIQICTGKLTYYFNFFNGADHEGNLPPKENVLPRSWVHKFRPLFKQTKRTWFIHNAKFDAIKLLLEEIEIRGSIHCTQTVERLLDNISRVSLSACADRRGYSKDDKVAAYIKENKLYEKVSINGKKKKIKIKFFHLVPFHIMVEYGCIDAYLAFVIGVDQLKQIQKTKGRFTPSLERVFENEKILTKVIIRMQQRGVLIDRPYCKKALAYELQEIEKRTKELEEFTGLSFNEPHFLRKSFDKFGYYYKINRKTKNPIFDKEALAEYDNPVSRIIKKKREHEKNAGTYYSSFLHFSDAENVLRANPNQSGTITGRMSYSDPNLQNIPKEDEDWKSRPFLVRSSIICRPDYNFLMVDYNQMEFRLMLDYAGESELIEKINAGMDVHQATADMVGITRKQAKTLNFGLLYGMGTDKLAKTLNIDSGQASTLKQEYFSKLKNVSNLFKNVSKRGLQRGFVCNWLGRRCNLNDIEKAYVLINHLIQGGCGDIIKVAMVRIEDWLRKNKLKSNILIQVHDELLFEIHKDELDIQLNLLEIMEDVYRPKRDMFLTCGADHSSKSWGQQHKNKGLIQ